MAGKFIRNEGKGLTERNSKRIRFDMKTVDDGEKLVRAHENMIRTLNSPWGANRQIIDACRKRFDELCIEFADQLADPDTDSPFAEPRMSEGWYLNEITATATLVEAAIEANCPWNAANRALILGELMAELRLSKHWNKDAIWGREQLIKRREGAAMARKSSAQSRYSDVVEYVANGRSKAHAFRLVGHKHGVSGHAVKKDYYDQKKLANPID